MQKKKFNITGVCNPKLHYMVDLQDRLQEMDERIDGNTYFTAVRPRQSGKTTFMFSLAEYLQEKYLVVMIDFQMIGTSDFSDEALFSNAFMRNFMRGLKSNYNYSSYIAKEPLSRIQSKADEQQITSFGILFETLSELCRKAKKPIILMIDEFDSAMNLPIFFDFLAQIRASYLFRKTTPTFYSVLLFGTKDFNFIEMDQNAQQPAKYYGPWNIFTEFPINLNFTQEDITGMLSEYENDLHTGMDLHAIAASILQITYGYPFLVSKICSILDEKIASVWNENTLLEAEKILGDEIETFIQVDRFDENPELKEILKNILFHAITR